MTFCDIDPGRWIDVPAFPIPFCHVHVLGHGNRLSLEPACRFDFHFFSVLLSQSETSYSQQRKTELHQKHFDTFARTLKDFLRTGSHAWSTNFSRRV